MTIVVVDSGTGNFGSILNILKRIGARGILTADPQVVESASKIILPGVGSFASCMAHLRDRGLIEVLNQKALVERVPVLGICVGMQIMATYGDEGDAEGLDWIAGVARKFEFPPDSVRPIPHMGWNTLTSAQSCYLWPVTQPPLRYYFLHSYHFVPSDDQAILAKASYGLEFVAAVNRTNIIGVQFHPEKSHRFGMNLFRNFAAAP